MNPSAGGEEQFDVFMTHDAPTGIGFEEKRRNNGVSVGNPYLQDIIEKRWPLWAFFGHYHVWHEARIGRTEVRGLQKLGPDTYNVEHNHFILEL